MEITVSKNGIDYGADFHFSSESVVRVVETESVNLFCECDFCIQNDRVGSGRASLDIERYDGIIKVGCTEFHKDDVEKVLAALKSETPVTLEIEE